MRERETEKKMKMKYTRGKDQARFSPYPWLKTAKQSTETTRLSNLLLNPIPEVILST